MIASGCSVLLAGWLAFDRGDGPAAHEFSSAAIRAAQGAADDGLLAAGLVHQSFAAARSGDPGTAWRLAHDAVLRTPYDRRATAWAASRVALYAAQLGEEPAARDGMCHALELGESLSDPMPGDVTAPWVGHFDRARLLSATARTAALLEDVNALDYAAQAVEALGPAKVKSRAVVLAEAALAAALAGELALCLDYGSAAAALTNDMDVSIAADVLHEIVPLILPQSDARPVRELLPQLVQLPRTADLRNRTEMASTSAYVLFPTSGAGL